MLWSSADLLPRKNLQLCYSIICCHKIIKLCSSMTMMIEVDKLRGIKSATVAIGLSNKDTNEVIDSFGTGFFIGGKYIEVRHMFLVNV